VRIEGRVHDVRRENTPVDNQLIRKLAAIAVADVVGYSRRMEADEAGTLAQITAIRRELVNPKVEQYPARLARAFRLRARPRGVRPPRFGAGSP
jgi:class 3 adenylate cyclase